MLEKILHCHQQWRETQISPLLVICHLSLVMCHISLVPSKCHNKALQNGHWHPWMASSGEKVREKQHYILSQHPRDCSKTEWEREKQLNFDQRLKIEIVLAQVLGGVPREKPGHGDHWAVLANKGKNIWEYHTLFVNIWKYHHLTLFGNIWG